MLTIKENFLECIRGGHPDRYVNQFEALATVSANPLFRKDDVDENGFSYDEWGVYWASKDLPGRMPIHDMEHRVVKDIANWREYVKKPLGMNDPAKWECIAEMAEKVDPNKMRTASIAPGVFERLHDLCEIQETCIALYEEPEAIHDLIKVITEVELEQAEMACKAIKPEALFHHDDWGSDASTFMSVEMFEEFLMPAYKLIYGYYTDHGVQVIVHQTDSFGATLVPDMIELGIDVWQGAVESNNLPELVDKYAGQIAIMSGIESQIVDRPDWTPELVNETVDNAIASIGHKTYFIPCHTRGGAGSIFPGVYDTVSARIDYRSSIDFA